MASTNCVPEPVGEPRSDLLRIFETQAKPHTHTYRMKLAVTSLPQSRHVLRRFCPNARHSTFHLLLCITASGVLLECHVAVAMGDRGSHRCTPQPVGTYADARFINWSTHLGYGSLQLCIVALQLVHQRIVVGLFGQVR